MTKAKARERAKAKAVEKAKKRLASAQQPAPGVRPGHFDPGAGSIKGASVNTNGPGAMRQGAARSR